MTRTGNPEPASCADDSRFTDPDSRYPSYLITLIAVLVFVVLVLSLGPGRNEHTMVVGLLALAIVGLVFFAPVIVRGHRPPANLKSTI